MMLKLNVLLCALGLAVPMTASCGAIVILDGVEDQGEGGSTTGYGASVGGYTSGSGIGGFGSTVSSTGSFSTGSFSTGNGNGGYTTCASYCKDIQANCTGANRQYVDEATCLKVCSFFPPGVVGATTGNSLECRAYHAGVPSKTDASIHCGHSGITGGDKDPGTTTDMAPCGPGCEAFCSIALKACPTIWSDEMQCLTDCSKFKASPKPFSTSETFGDTFNCRAYHLTVATQTPVPHCEHIKLDSLTCK